MTSTSVNVGLGEGPRRSSRVLLPPGGGHTDIFGGEPEPMRGRRQFPGLANAGQGDEPAKPRNGTSPTQNGQPEAPQQAASEPIPAKVDAPPKPESPKTEEHQPTPAPASTPAAAEAPKADPPKVDTPKEDAPKVDPPKRVRVPPGGFSSGLW